MAGAIEVVLDQFGPKGRRHEFGTGILANLGTGAGRNSQRQQLNACAKLVQAFQICLLEGPALARYYRKTALAQKLLGLDPTRDLAHQIASHREHQVGPRPEMLGPGQGFDGPRAAELLFKAEARIGQLVN